MSNIDIEIEKRVAHIERLKGEVEVLKKAKPLLDKESVLPRGYTFTGAFPEKILEDKRVKPRKFKVAIQDAIWGVFEAMPDTLLDARTVTREVRRSIPSVNSRSVQANIIKLFSEHRLERPARGLYVYYPSKDRGIS